MFARQHCIWFKVIKIFALSQFYLFFSEHISDMEDPAVFELLLCLLEVDGNIYFLLLTAYG